MPLRFYRYKQTRNSCGQSPIYSLSKNTQKLDQPKNCLLAKHQHCWDSLNCILRDLEMAFTQWELMGSPFVVHLIFWQLYLLTTSARETLGSLPREKYWSIPDIWLTVKKHPLPQRDAKWNFATLVRSTWGRFFDTYTVPPCGRKIFLQRKKRSIDFMEKWERNLAS